VINPKYKAGGRVRAGPLSGLRTAGAIEPYKSAAPVISAQQLGIYGRAPHINGAKLFAEWMITPEGQMAVSAVGREVSRKGVKSKASIEYA
jgi:hypothetical protein